MIRQSGSPYAKKARVKEGGGSDIHLLNAETGCQLLKGYANDEKDIPSQAVIHPSMRAKKRIKPNTMG